MKIVGLTGGIGSGKSVVADMLSSFGIPVFNADASAKSQYKDPKVIEQVAELVGSNDFINEDGELNKQKLAAIIFNDPVKRQMVNDLIHPLVKKHFDQWKNQFDLPYCIREAAILIESGSYKDCDEIIVVTSTIENRIERVVQRDHTSPEEVEKRIKAQMSEEERLTYANYIIHNDGTLRELYPEVLKVHEQLL
jgi:dephospho-CoA kinase